MMVMFDWKASIMLKVEVPCLVRGISQATVTRVKGLARLHTVSRHKPA